MHREDFFITILYNPIIPSKEINLFDKQAAQFYVLRIHSRLTKNVKASFSFKYIWTNFVAQFPK